MKSLISDFADSKDLVNKKDFKELSVENQNSLLKIALKRGSDLISFVFKNCNVNIK